MHGGASDQTVRLETVIVRSALRLQGCNLRVKVRAGRRPIVINY